MDSLRVSTYLNFTILILFLVSNILAYINGGHHKLDIAHFVSCNVHVYY